MRRKGIALTGVPTRRCITFDVPGQPVPKQRPRVVGKQAFTPARTRIYEQQVGWLARRAVDGMEPFADDVSLRLLFRRSGKLRADLDNLVKAVLDGLSGVLFEDDRQIVYIEARVEYGSKNPGVLVVCEG